MSNPNPKYLKPHDGLTATQRKSLGLEKVPPRERQAGEAMPITYCNASTKGRYVAGFGDSYQHVRTGSDHAMAIKSIGFRT
jgi:hypothetical protein